jgi:hypothetical protein
MGADDLDFGVYGHVESGEQIEVDGHSFDRGASGGGEAAGSGARVGPQRHAAEAP